MYMNYKELAIEAGYTKGTDEQLEKVGMAIERGEVAWDWFKAGDDKFDVAAIFQYSDESPNYETVVGSYAEGMANELGIS